MSLRNALLALLAREPMTGYDLTKSFDRTVGAFWSAKHSQIYPELAALAKDGLVEFELVTQTSKPNKKVYRVTPTGLDSLVGWLAEPPERRNVKDPLLMRMWVVGLVEPGPALAVLRAAEPALAERVAALKQVESEAMANGGFLASPENTHLGATMVLRAGQMQAEAYLNWLRWAIAQLEIVTQGGPGQSAEALAKAGAQA